MRFVLSVLILIISCAALGYYSYVSLERWGALEIAQSEAQIIELPRGTSLKNLSDTLFKVGLVDNRSKFRLWTRLFSNYGRFQAGKYRFEGRVSPKHIAAKIIKGDIFVPVVLEVTIPEGFTLKQVFARLAAKGVAEKSEFEKLASDLSFLRSLQIEADSLEGYLYPATYQFSEMPTAQAAIEKMVKTFWVKLPKGYSSEVKKLGLSLNQAVIFASLIELETPNDDEKPFVAEVIWRRLKANTTLGIDAALIYGIKDYDGDIRSKDLNDRSNKYNTRIYPGLPPTAIGSPAISSLRALLVPSNEGYYYYVVDANNPGRHYFSKTLREHNARVRELVRKGRKQG